jgi:hypothetical protein
VLSSDLLNAALCLPLITAQLVAVSSPSIDKTGIEGEGHCVKYSVLFVMLCLRTGLPVGADSVQREQSAMVSCLD